MTTFKKYCHRFKEQRLGKEEKSRANWDTKKIMMTWPHSLCFRQHGKLNLRSTFQIHKGGPQNFKTRGKKINTEIYFELWGFYFYQVPLTLWSGFHTNNSSLADSSKK